MKLNDILHPYKYFSLASKEDNQGILDFFKSMKMETKSYSLRYDRGNDYFQFAYDQSQNPFVFLMRNDEGQILGTAAIAVIPHIINGKRELTGYLGDLRISPLLNAKIRLTWKKCYRDLIVHFKEIEEFKGIKYLYSAILDENQNAMRSLLKNNDDLIYEELTNYETYNFFLKKPSFSSKLSTLERQFSISTTSSEELRAFYDTFKSLPGMQDDYGKKNSIDSQDELDRRLSTWENFSIDSFKVVRNKEQKIIAAFAPWIPQSKKLVVESIDKKLAFIGALLPLFGVPAIKVKKDLTVLYLTHLKFEIGISNKERQDVLDFITQHYLKSPKRNFHLISFFTFPHWKYENQYFLGEKTKGRFYQVMSKKEFDEKQFLPLHNNPPAFEIGIA